MSILDRNEEIGYLDFLNQKTGLVVSGPGAHNVGRSGTRTPNTITHTPRGKIPTDGEIDKLTEKIIDQIDSVADYTDHSTAYATATRNIRSLIRDWLANH